MDRNDCDKNINRHGRLLLDMCTATCFRILNDSKDQDREDNYTCITSQGNIVMYLVVCRTEMFTFIYDQST